MLKRILGVVIAAGYAVFAIPLAVLVAVTLLVDSASNVLYRVERWITEPEGKDV